MQTLKIRRGNGRCSKQPKLTTNCIQKSQRIRCCGRVTDRQEVDEQILISNQGRGHRQCIAKGQGQGRDQGVANS